MAFDPQLWGAAGVIVGTLAAAIRVLDGRARSDAEARLAEAKRSIEVLALATRAIEASNDLNRRLLDFLEDNDPRSTPQSRKTYEPR